MRTGKQVSESVGRVCKMLVGPAVLAMAMASCTSTTNGGSGGSSAGGNTSSGGATSSGGTTSSGGSKASGGTTSSGGATSSSGGATSAGGTTTGAGGGSSNGGATNAGGSSAAGGSTAAGGTTGTTGIDGGTAGSSGGVTVQLDKTKQTIEGFGLNTALGGGTVPWDTFYTTTGSGLGFSIVRVGMDSGGKLSGSMPASSYNAKVIGSVWTAPASCKDNNNESKGGHLLTSCYD